MVAMGKKAWFALMNWKTRMGSPRSPVRTRPLPLPGYRAPGAVAGSHAADGSAPRARRWSGRPVGGLHRDQPDEPSSRSPGRSVRTRATAPPVFAQIGPEQPSVAGIPAHRVGDSSASMTPPSQMQRCPPNRVNSSIERQPRKKLEPSPERLLAVLHRWRDEAVRAGRTITRIALAFEAGRDGFWLARWLAARGVEAHVIHASSVAVSREHRRAKTDRLDTAVLKRGFLGGV